MSERHLSTVPKLSYFILAIALIFQMTWNRELQVQDTRIEKLGTAPSIDSFYLASFGEPIAMAKLSTLYLQAFDHQGGTQIPFNQLNYTQLTTWLSRIITLDPASQYPLFLASRLYGEVGNPEKQRIMLEFVYQEFLKDPNHRWASMAHAATLAKHRLKDIALARKYAQALRLYATAETVPSWAKQMEIFILEDMNELQSAKIILGGLLQSGKIKDQHEIQFLEQRLIVLENKIVEENKEQKK
jgi:hypothetical protein